MKAPNLDDLVRRYLAGEPIHKLCRENSFCDKTLKRWLLEAGVKLRSRAEATSLSNRRSLTPSEESEIVARYLAGATVKDLVERFGYSSGNLRCKRYPKGSGIRGVLDRNGVALRPVSTIRQKWWDERRDPEFRAAHVREAQAAGARMRETSLQVRMSPQEHQLFGALTALGARCTQQRCVGVYNLDISFDELPIAVEIETGSAFAAGRKTFAFKRIEHLLNQGWNVVYVILGRKLLRTPTVAQKLITFSERVRSDETLRGQYGVICSQGNPISSSRYYLESWPRIPAL